MPAAMSLLAIWRTRAISPWMPFMASRFWMYFSGEMGWPLRLSVLQDAGATVPEIPELLGASEAVVFTSLIEGFGLPFLEAAQVGCPLLARRLANVAPDLRRFGFEFPHQYREVLVAPSLFDVESERRRQETRFERWRALLPRAARARLGIPPLLADRVPSRAIAFSRLTLTAQIEVLRADPETSWKHCATWNPVLEHAREQALHGGLSPTAWPASADRWLSAAAFAQRFRRLLTAPSPRSSTDGVSSSESAQETLLRRTLAADNLYPLLWSTEP